MTGSRASAFSNPDHVLICGVNWIGDSVMSMPAIQAFAAAHPETRIDMLVKPGLAALWEMHPAISDIVQLHSGPSGAWRASRRIRAQGVGRAYVFPHSFRSALPAFLARVPERIGMPGHHRDLMLTRVIRPRATLHRSHQQFEYADLLLPGGGQALPSPALRIPAVAHQEAERLLAGKSEWIGFMPGAARGPSKRWPASHFIEAGRRWIETTGDGVAVMGAPSEAILCESVAQGIGEGAACLAGRLSVGSWAAALQRCRVVVANDSGGMHLAAGLGTPVVALFGHTDPARTGPLGTARILQNSATRNRAIAHDSTAARSSLASIEPGTVYDALQDLADAG